MNRWLATFAIATGCMLPSVATDFADVDATIAAAKAAVYSAYDHEIVQLLGAYCHQQHSPQHLVHEPPQELFRNYADTLKSVPSNFAGDWGELLLSVRLLDAHEIILLDRRLRGTVTP